MSFESTINNLVDENARLKAANAKLKAANAKMKKERDELYRDNVRLRSMANGTPDDAFVRLLTFADWWDANYPFSPDEGKILRKSWAKIVQLQMANARMREALLIISGGKEARGNYEEVAWHMAQLAAEAIAVEGEKKMSDCFSCIHFGKCSYDPTYCHSWDTKVAEGGAK